MIDWQPMSTASKSGDPVLVLFRCPLTTKLEVSPAWFDDGTDEDGEVVNEPGWHAFDQMETEEVFPLAWAAYPTPDEAAWAKLGIEQVSA